MEISYNFYQWWVNEHVVQDNIVNPKTCLDRSKAYSSGLMHKKNYKMSRH